MPRRSLRPSHPTRPQIWGTKQGLSNLPWQYQAPLLWKRAKYTMQATHERQSISGPRVHVRTPPKLCAINEIPRLVPDRLSPGVQIDGRSKCTQHGRSQSVGEEGHHIEWLRGVTTAHRCQIRGAALEASHTCLTDWRQCSPRCVALVHNRSKIASGQASGHTVINREHLQTRALYHGAG